VCGLGWLHAALRRRLGSEVSGKKRAARREKGGKRGEDTNLRMLHMNWNFLFKFSSCEGLVQTDFRSNPSLIKFIRCNKTDSGLTTNVYLSSNGRGFKPGRNRG
jgi:hypothetical protein